MTQPSSTPERIQDSPRRLPAPLPRPAPVKASPALVERFDFAAGLATAHLRSGGILIDFGTPARHKHTLGDWRSGISGNFENNGVTYSYMTGRTARVYFHALEDEAGGGAIALRIRGLGPSQARVYLNGKLAGTIEPNSKGFSHATVAVETGIVAGPNELRIQCNARGKTKEGLVAAMAIDYIRIIPETTESGPAASDYTAVRYLSDPDGEGEIGLAAGESLTYYLPIPDDARLQGVARSRTDGRSGQIALSVRTDGKEAPLEVTRDLDRGSKRIDMDLSKLDGKAAEITIAALQGEVLLKDLGLFTPPKAKDKAPGALGARNLVLVLIDTLRADKLALYNPDTRVRTTYLSRLGKESMTFKRALAPENWTKPSVASLLTGLYPSTHGTKDDRDKLPTSVTTIQEHLKSLGFVTAGFVANGYVSDKFGFRRGFDSWTNYVREGKPNRAQFVVDDAAAWLQKKTDDKPFFLYVHTIDPHVPYIPPNKYLQMYDVGPYNGPVKASATAKLAEQIKTHRITLNDRDKMRFEALYDGEITYHDDQLVRLQEALDNLGLLRDTAIIVTADHGEEFFEHGLVGHGHSMYEELLHVPLIVRLPDATAKATGGPVTDSEVSLVDVFPTACDLLGIECPKAVEGESLVPILKGERAPFPSAAFSEFLEGQRAARMGRYKLILRGDRTTLFDLKRDPRETADLSDEEPIALTAIRGALGAHLGRFARISAAGNGEKKSPAHKPEKATLDPETQKQLKALGYLGGE